MQKKRKKRDPDEPRPLNFDHDEKKGPKKTYLTQADARGDDENEQYYQEEEALSPEETKLRKKEGNL